MNSVAFVAIIQAVRRLYRSIAPDIVYHVSLQPTIVGSLATAGLSLKGLNALAGLGYTLTSSTLKARLVRSILRVLLRYVLGHRNASVLVQNTDDRAAVRNIVIAGDRIFVVPGSGVDMDALTLLPEPPVP